MRPSQKRKMLLREQKRVRARLAQIDEEIVATEQRLADLKTVLHAASALGDTPTPTAGSGKLTVGARKGPKADE